MRLFFLLKGLVVFVFLIFFGPGVVLAASCAVATRELDRCMAQAAASGGRYICEEYGNPCRLGRLVPAPMPATSPVLNMSTGTICGTIAYGSTSQSQIRSWNTSDPNCYRSAPY